MNLMLSEAEKLFEYTRNIRRDIHKYPEIGMDVPRTAGIVSSELEKLGMAVQTGIAQTGVVGFLQGNKPGPVILIRADMDALPIQEETGADYASTFPGLMHACGHDGHTAIALTAAKLLHNHREEMQGSVKFIFQPGEEGYRGAEKMVNAGVLENPEPQYALGLHLWNGVPIGRVAVVPGPFMAGIDRFTIHIKGVGGHGGLPDTTIDPVVAAAHIIAALQSIVSRNLSPFHAAVISACRVQAGNAFNIIPGSAVIEGNIRTFEPEVHQKVWERLKNIARDTAQAFGCQAEVVLDSINRSVINDEWATHKVASAVRSTLPDFVIDSTFRTTVSEDMSVILEKIPGCFFFVGSANPAEGLHYSHHHPRFDFDEQVMPKAAAIMASAALELMNAS